MEPRKEKKGRFSITKLEMRIAPAPGAALIALVATTSGATHACPGPTRADHDPNQAVQLARHQEAANEDAVQQQRTDDQPGRLAQRQHG